MWNSVKTLNKTTYFVDIYNIYCKQKFSLVGVTYEKSSKTTNAKYSKNPI